MVRSPSGVDTVGEPDVAVSRIVAPVAVVIEVLVADDIGRKVVRGAGIIVAVIAGFGPCVEVIRTVKLFHIGVGLIRTAKCGALAAAQFVALASARGLAIAFANADDGVVSIAADFDAIMTGLKDGEGLIGCVDLEVVVFAQAAHGDVDCAGGELKLHGIVVEVEEGESSHGPEADDGRTKLHFGAGTLVGPKLVAGGQGTVGDGTHPIAFAGRLEGNGTFHVAQASDAAGRIVLILSRCRIRQNESGK
jgi:hypothetical protein